MKKGDEYAILTNLIHEEWSGIGVKDHKNLKGLKTQNLAAKLLAALGWN